MNIAKYAKKRLDIFVEAPALQQVIDALTAAGVQGYTVLEATSGQGHAGHWRLDDSFNNATNILVKAVNGCNHPGFKRSYCINAVIICTLPASLRKAGICISRSCHRKTFTGITDLYSP